MTLTMAKAIPIYQDGSPDETDKQRTQIKLPLRFAPNANSHSPSSELQHIFRTRQSRSANQDVEGHGPYGTNDSDKQHRKRTQQACVKAPSHRNHKSYGDIPSPEKRRYTADLCITDAEHLESIPMPTPKRVAILKLKSKDAISGPPDKTCASQIGRTGEQTIADQFIPNDLAEATGPFEENPESPLEDTTEGDDDDNATVSATSAGEQAGRDSARRAPHTADKSGISESWQYIHDQRSEVKRQRRDLTTLMSKLKLKRREKAEADRELHMLTLNYSKAEQQLPRQKVVQLFSKAEKLNDTCDTMESQYEELESKLERKAAKLEAHENVFFRTIARSAVNSHVSATMAPHPQGAATSTNGTTRQRVSQVADQIPQEERKRPTGRTSTEGANNVSQQQSSMDTALMGISGERPRKEHPVYGQLLHTVGELKIAKEGHVDLRLERDDIIYELQGSILRERSRKGEAYNPVELQTALKDDYQSDRFKDSFSSYLSNGDLDFLRQWRTKTKEARSKITATKKLVGRIRDWCKSNDALPEYMPLEEQEIVLGSVLEKEKEATAISVEINAAVGQTFSARNRRAVLAHRTFPRLLSNPYYLLEPRPITAKAALDRALNLPDSSPFKRQAKEDGIKEYGIETTLFRFVEGRKMDFVNRWLLQQLRTSPLEVVRLFMIMSDILSVINLLRWQDDVVRYWSLDDANKQINTFDHTTTEPEESAIDRVSLSSLSSSGRVRDGGSQQI
ncbi:hypothetical protein F503_07470 [Ophiostoma piceae UAMH 11346]|uniref:Uncharacterized protein n=1 Tax=Ophiostoma piceae (strain UAMH 11346) TaxID=1262450 RepID=S3C873_OPHP1|nr:hypothetical protein F503_07470 [Ophiostoma piceae UAMH 11346]